MINAAAPSVNLAYLAGGGEMGALMRAHDWATTPLGPLKSWPQSLRSAASIMLNSRYPIALYWGPELALLYNDAWSPIPGGKHPWALGRPGREVWPEIWDTIGPLYERVFSTGEGVWQEDELLPMNRHGYLEECYYNFTFSPVRGEDGRIDGIFNAVVETTDRVLSERRLRALSRMGERTDPALSVQAACRRALDALSENKADVPFALVYLCENKAGDARLIASAGVEADSSAAPSLIPLGGSADGVWPLTEVQRAAASVVIAPSKDVALPASVWPEPVAEVIVAPVTMAGDARPCAFLIAGANPRRRIDAGYRSFFELAAGHVATAITTARAYEEERRRSQALAAIDRAKTQFFSNVSHEFRTPLTLMLGPLEDALAEPDAGAPQQRERLDLAHRNALRLLRLVNALLDFSRIEAGRVQASFRPTDLAALTADLASSFRSATDKAGLRLVVDAPPLSQPAFVDRDMWETILLNLVSNAFKFTLEGEIRVELRADDGRARLTVRDTGTGIPASELPKLFDRFHRVEGAQGRSFEGSGIGLALVQELVKQHGGEIAVKSQEGQGTTFTVTIPIGAEHRPAERLEASSAPNATAARAQSFVEEALRWLPGDAGDALLDAGAARDLPPTRVVESDGAERRRVLVADDNADLRDYIARLLAERGYKVSAVADGTAALAAARARRPDLLVADVMMPGLDGFALLRAVRDDKALRDLPVIMLSARAGEEAKVEGLDAGANDYLTKPFSARELLARVSANIAMAQLRREATAAIIESEARFRNMADHAPVMMWVTDPSGCCIYLNRGWYEFTGQTREDAEGFGWLEATHPDDKAAAERVFLDANARHEPFRLEYRLRRHDGAYRWAIDAASPRFGADGEFLGYVGSVIDIDERREAEDALRASEERYRTLFEAIDAGFCVVEVKFDQHGRAVDHFIVEVNPAFERQTSVVGAAGRWASEAAPGIEQHWNDTYARVALTGEAVRFENAVEPFGRWYDVYAFPIGEPGQNRVAVLFNDISDRRRAELALREMNETLEQRVEQRTAERDRLWTLSEDMLARADYTGMMSAVSPAWTRVLGFSEAELLARPYVEFMHPDDAGTTVAALARMGETGAPTRFENRILSAAGAYKLIEWTVAPEPDGVNFIAVGRDVSAERQRQIELDAAQEALRQSQKMESMGQLTGGVAHDFNNLLTPIVGALDMLQRKGLGGEREQRLIHGAAQSAERAKVLVQRLLAFARRQPLQPIAVDVSKLVRNMADLVSSTTGPQIRVTVETADGLPLAKADPNQLEMALLNLAVNARDAMPEGGTLRISASAETARAGANAQVRPGRYVRVSVADTGTGMDEATLARAVDPFFSTKGVGKGTGLGLSMVHGLASQLGGALTIKSRLGVGTNIELWLPQTAETPEPPAVTAEVAASRGRGTALLVDDEEFVRLSTADMLGDLGYRVVEAESAEDALRLISNGAKVDLVVTDHLMPGMTGTDLARTVRERHRGLPVLIVSGYAEMDGVAADLPRLTKPFRKDELAASLAGLSSSRSA